MPTAQSQENSDSSALQRLPLLIVLAALFLISRLAIIYFSARIRGDLRIYGWYAFKIGEGKLPFARFKAEYPPVALWFMSIPALFTKDELIYRNLYRGMLFLIDAGIFSTLLRHFRASIAPAVIYLACTSALGPLLYTRLDLALGALLMAALFLLLDGRLYSFFAVVGIAIAFKIIPVIWFAPVVAWSWKERGFLFALTTAALLMSPLFFSLLIVYELGGTKLPYLFAYHLHRGAEIESFISSIQMIASKLGFVDRITVYRANGSHNITSALASILLRSSSVLMLLLISSGAVLCAFYKLSKETLALYLVWLLAAAMIFSKVLSPQYFLFLIPPYVAVAVRGDSRSKIITGLLFVACLLTGIIYPWGYTPLLHLATRSQILIVSRNIILFLFCAVFFVYVRNAFRERRQAAPAYA